MICVGCGKKPEELEEYFAMAIEEGMTADEWCYQEEGTLNIINGHFYCTDCYIKAGKPLGKTE